MIKIAKIQEKVVWNFFSLKDLLINGKGFFIYLRITPEDKNTRILIPKLLLFEVLNLKTFSRNVIKEIKFSDGKQIAHQIK